MGKRRLNTKMEYVSPRLWPTAGYIRRQWAVWCLCAFLTLAGLGIVSAPIFGAEGGAFPSELYSDVETGRRVNSKTGLRIDAQDGIDADAETGIYIDPETGIRVDPQMATHADSDGLLTLEEALLLTLQHSPRVQRALSAGRQSAAELEEALSIKRPRWDVAGELERAQDPLSPSPTPGEPVSQMRLSLSYQQVLGESEDTRLSLEAARVADRIAQLEQRREILQALSDVLNAYVSVLEADGSLSFSQMIERNAVESARVVREQVREGTATETDLLAAETAADRARHGVAVAETSLHLAYEALYQTMGISNPERWPRLQTATELLEASELEGELPQLLEYARASRPDILQAEWALEGVKLALRQAERAQRPRVEVGGSYGWTESGQAVAFSLDDNAALGVTVSHQDTLGGGREANRLEPSEDSWRLGAQVRWNLADGGATSLRVEQLQEQRTQAEFRLEELQAALSLILVQQYDEVVQALQEVSISDGEALEAQRRLDITRAQWKSGTATELDVWQAEAQLARSELDRLRAQTRVLRARMALAVAVGADEKVVFQGFSTPGP